MYEAGQLAVVPDFSGRSIFCEDIRKEASGQVTLVGCLPDAIHVDKFPATINKLCVFVELQLAGDSEDLPITLKGFLPGSSVDTPYIETVFDFPEEMKLAATKADPVLVGTYPAHPVKRIHQFITTVNLQIDQAGPIQLRAFRNGVIYAIGALTVIESPIPEDAAPSAE